MPVDAQYIWDNSDLLVKENCVILDNVLYERCDPHQDFYPQVMFRFFLDVDHYDYVEDNILITLLNKKFNCI